MINRAKNLWVGGDYIQLEKTAEALRSLGVEVDISETPLPSPAIGMYQYDIVHIFNFSMAWAKLGVWSSRSKGLRTVVSMIYHEKDDFVSYPDQQIMIDNIQAAIFLTKGELERAERHIKVPKDIIHFLPNGIDEHWFEKVEPIDCGVLTVGRIETFKGQLHVAKACKELGLKYTCIGEVIEQEVADKLKGLGAIILPPMPPEELKPYYAGCSVFVLASRAELMPLTVMEAGAQAKNIILTNHCEWELPNVEYVEFCDIKGISTAIDISLKKKPNTELQEMLKGMRWSDIGKRLLKIYEGLY